jgi:hypothetical protein
VPWGFRDHLSPASLRINFNRYDFATEIHRNDRMGGLMQCEFVNRQRLAGRRQDHLIPTPAAGIFRHGQLFAAAAISLSEAKVVSALTTYRTTLIGLLISTK